MEFTATFKDEISSSANAATASLRALHGMLESVDKALKTAQASGVAVKKLSPQGGGGAADASAKAAEKAAKAEEKAQSKAFAEFKRKGQERFKESLKEDKRREKEESKAVKEAEKAAKEKGKAHKEFSDKVKNGANNIALASYAAAGAMMAYGLPLALGYKGMAKMQMIGAKMTLDIRKLFTGVNPAPVLRAAERFTAMFSKTTSTGRVLEGIVGRVFNGLFGFFERAEPYVSSFIEGLIGGFLKGEIAILKTRIALYPFTSILEDATESMDGLSLAARAGTAAMGLLGLRAIWAAGSTTVSLVGMGIRGVASLGSLVVSSAGATAGMARLAVSTLAAAAPYIALAAAIAAVCLALDQANKLSKEWDSNSSSQIWTKLKNDVGITSDAEASAEMNKRQGIVTGAEYDKLHPPQKAAAAATPPKAVTAMDGASSGAAMGDGLVKGMQSKEAEVLAAGKALGKAADTGVKSAAEIKSPSRKMRRSGGYMGEGLVLGMKDTEDDVQKAAANSLVPDLGKASPTGPKAAAKGSEGSGLTINFNGPVSGSVEDFEGAVRRVWLSDMRDVLLSRGVKV